MAVHLATVDQQAHLIEHDSTEARGVSVVLC